MVHRVRTFAAPPVLKDEEQTRLARFLHWILLAGIGVNVFDMVLLAIFAPETLPTFWINGLILGFFTLSFWMVRRGRVRAASLVLCVPSWAVLTYYLSVSGGVTSPAFGFLSLFIIIGAVLLGVRGAGAFGLLCIGTAVGLYWAGSNGWLILIEQPPTPARLFATYTAILVSLTILMSVSGRSERDALMRARTGERSLAERNRQLEREIVERERAEEALRASEEAALEFQEKLVALHEVSIELAKADSLDTLYRQAIELGRARLGFERMGLLLYHEATNTMSGTFGTDAAGMLRDERELARSIAADSPILDVLRNKARVWVLEDAPLYDDFEIVGRGWNAMAVLWNGDTGIGWLATDNLLTGAPLKSYQAELLSLYGITLGHLVAQHHAEDRLRASAEEFRQLSDSAIEGIAITENGRIILANARIAEMFGYDHSEFIGMHVQQLVAPESRDLVSQYMRAGYDKPYDHMVVRKDGMVFPVEVQGRQMIYGGRTVRVTAIRDISERKQAEEALKSSDERFSRAFRSSPIPLTISSLTEGRFVDVNESCLNTLGYTRDEMVGHSVEELQTWVDPQERAEVLRLLETQGTVLQQEVRFRTKSGGVRHALASFETIELSGEPYLLGSWQDITERKQAEADLKRSEQRFYQAFHANPTPITLSTVHDARFVDVNESLLALFGYTREEMIGHTAFELNSWADFEERRRIVEQLEAQGTIRQMEARFRKKSGEVGDALISVDVIEIAGEGHLLFMIQDITERKLAEVALKRSEERFFKAFHANPIAISISTLEEGRFVDVNESFMETTGFSRDEIVGHTGFELGFWDTPEERGETVTRLRADGHIRQHPTKLPTKPGPTRDALTDMEIIELAGEPHLLSMIQDVTEQRRAQKALKLSEERFFKAFEANPTAISISTLAEGRYVDANESFINFTGYTRQALIGHTALELGFWLDEQDRADVVRRLTEEPKLLHIEAEFLTPRGETRYGLTSMEIIEVGGEPHLLSMVQDVTERKRAEQQALELALSREREASLRDFLSTISHDLKTPLSVINTSLYLLERVADPKRQQEKIETIKAQSQLLEKYIQDILTISRLDHTPALTRRAVDLHQLLAEVVQRLRPSAERKNLTAALELDADTASVLGDENELDRVLVNLIENAMIYTPANGSIRVHTVMDTGFIIAEIADTGIGIKDKDMPHIFERFYRSEEAQAMERRGTGLGLAIVKKIVELHEGSIEVSSVAGEGTIFRVRLPMA